MNKNEIQGQLKPFCDIPMETISETRIVDQIAENQFYRKIREIF